MHPGGRGGYLDEQVVTPHRLPQPPCGRFGSRTVVRQSRRDFQADIASLAKAGCVSGQKGVAGRLDVGNNKRLVTRLGIKARTAQALHILTVVRAVGNGFLEDGGIGGHAVDAVLGHQTLQDAFLKQRAREIIEPGMLAHRLELKQGIVVHGLAS